MSYFYFFKSALTSLPAWSSY